jgi:elongation factor Ts
MMDCKTALNETDGDLEAAVDWLRKKGLSKAAKKAGRVAAEGLVAVESSGHQATILEVNSETDFVARNEQFQTLVRNVAMQIAGLRPRYVSVESIPAEELEAKRTELLADPATQAKPDAVRDRIVEGQLRKWFQEVVLLEQPYRDTDQTVKDLVADAVATIGENIRVRRFTRYELGEEL